MATPNNPSQTSLMIVDDSAVIRGLFSKVLETESGITVVAKASGGEQAIQTLKRLAASGQTVDVMTLDIQMPDMDGLEALPKLLAIMPDMKVIMASTLSTKGAKETLEALAMGAADYLAKPDTKGKRELLIQFGNELASKVKILGKRRATSGEKGVKPVLEGGVSGVSDYTLRSSSNVLKPSVLAIGSSTGGPQALISVLTQISKKKINIPILVTQHMPAEFTAVFAQQVQNSTGLTCTEGIDGATLVPGHVYIAPGNYHMLAEKDGAKVVIRTNQDEPENFCRPAVDPMLRSLVKAYGGRVLTVILTGMGSDGMRGAKVVVDKGGVVIAQDRKTSVVWGMPRAVADAGLCTKVTPLGDIGREIILLSQGQIG